MRISSNMLRCYSHDDAQVWCHHIKELVLKNEDAHLIHQRMHIFVPLFVEAAVWPEVQIHEELEPGGPARMTLKHSDSFNQEVKYPLGLWNPGEGLRSIRAVILDFLLSNLHPDEDMFSAEVKTQCPSSTHDFKARQKMSLNTSKAWKQGCVWNIVMEKACTTCVEDSLSSDPDSGDEGKVNPQPSGLPNSFLRMTSRFSPGGFLPQRFRTKEQIEEIVQNNFIEHPPRNIVENKVFETKNKIWEIKERKYPFA